MLLDQVLNAAVKEDFAHYHPQYVINAVNALLPFGKNAALHAVESYIADQDTDNNPLNGLFLVLRVLFEVPADPGYHPPLHLGGTAPPPPPEAESLPLFPLVLIDDRPLMMVSGFVLGGDTIPVTIHIDHFRKNGILRAKSLAPSQSADTVLERFRSVYQYAYGKQPSQHEAALIKLQLTDTGV